jgi:hypothetical protein
MMTTLARNTTRTLAVLTLALGAFASSASAQAPKEVTDGFFDVPARDPSEVGESYGVPSYMITSALGGLAVFILCKSARRG